MSQRLGVRRLLLWLAAAFGLFLVLHLSLAMMVAATLPTPAAAIVVAPAGVRATPSRAVRSSSRDAAPSAATRTPATRKPPKKPKPHLAGAWFSVAPDSSVKVQAVAFITGQLALLDIVRFDFYRNDTLQAAATVRVRALLAQATLGAPDYGGKALYKACFLIERNGPSGEKSKQVCTPVWTYTRGLPPLAQPDSAQLKALSFLLAPREVAQLCFPNPPGGNVVPGAGERHGEGLPRDDRV